MTELIDAYAHVGRPRFQDADDYWHQAARIGVARAVFSAFDSSPDLDYLLSLAATAPDRVRVLGVPVGSGRERRSSVQSQLAAGAVGIRLGDRDLASVDGILDAVAESAGIAFVCGSGLSLAAQASELVDYLEHYGEAIVLGGHFASPRQVSALSEGPVHDLFSHPRFYAVLSRHGAFAPDVLVPWTEALIDVSGWRHLMWGSESPVLHWRNETMASAAAWIDKFSPSASERDAFFSENARALFFDRPTQIRIELLDFDPWASAPVFPATLWSNGVPVRQDIAGRLIQSWNDSDDSSLPLGAHLEQLLNRVLPELRNPASPIDAP